MAKQPTTETQNDDPISVLNSALDEMKANIDKAGIAEWRALRNCRKQSTVSFVSWRATVRIKPKHLSPASWRLRRVLAI
jgi:hypothetical protein